jgi:hypothetical protein
MKSPAPSECVSTSTKPTPPLITFAAQSGSLSKLKQDEKHGSPHTQPAPITRIHIAKAEQAVYSNEGVNATSLWIMTPDGIYSAQISSVKHTTIKELFEAIVTAFNEQCAKFPSPSRLQKLALSFTNLGFAFQHARILTMRDDDVLLKQLQNDINSGFDRHRDCNEKVIGLATAYFELEVFELMEYIG